MTYKLCLVISVPSCFPDVILQTHIVDVHLCECLKIHHTVTVPALPPPIASSSKMGKGKAHALSPSRDNSACNFLESEEHWWVQIVELANAQLALVCSTLNHS